MQKPKVGHVYVLVSPHSDCIKIGGTDHPPLKRIREINSCEPYRALGPWTLADFRQVTDWRAVEYSLHYMFRSQFAVDVKGQRELFRIAPQIASTKLSEIDPALVMSRPKIDRMFQDREFAAFLSRMFAFTGLMNWLDIQGAWTFVLFPSTGWGRYYTINVGTHEVAFTTLPRDANPPHHCIVVDRLVYDFPPVKKWLTNHNGGFGEDRYATALPRSVSLIFEGEFADALELLELDGVRRALVAYWGEALIGLKERGSSSMFARFHNWNAVRELRNRALARA